MNTATSEKKHKVIRIIFISVIFGLFAFMFWPFLTAILLAALFAFALNDVVAKLSVRKTDRRFASIFLLLAILFFVATPILFLTITTVSTIKEYVAIGIQNTSFYHLTLKLVHQISEFMVNIGARLHIDTTSLTNPAEILNEYSGELGAFGAKIIAKIPQFVLNLFVFFLALYYFLNESEEVKHFILRFDLVSESEMNKIVGIIKSSSFRTLVASILIAAVQALVISLFGYFSGFTDFFLVFIVAFVFALVPVVGSAPVSIFLVLISFIQGNNGAGIAMIFAFVIASSLDNLIKPLILKTSTDDIHPIILLLALIGGILVYGAPGILLGPVLTQLAFNILSILNSDDISGEIVTDSDL